MGGGAFDRLILNSDRKYSPHTTTKEAIMNKTAFKTAFTFLLQWMGAIAAFILSLIIASLISPLPDFILEKTPPAGFLPTYIAMLLNAAVNGILLVWAARRSSFKGFKLAGALLVFSFLAQTLLTQVETAYFISAFPLLQGNFVVFGLLLQGLITSSIFALLVTLITGGFSRKKRAKENFTVRADQFLKASAWLGAVYVVLYLLFGYFVAWQSQELRLFYGGPAELNSFASQTLTTLMGRPEMPFFQYARGILWIVCLAPLFKAFTGKRLELVVLSGLALALLPAAQLAFANPLMPANVSLYHFWEVSISTGIFGAVCAWFVPTGTASSK
jgi:hypothetical protein